MSFARLETELDGLVLIEPTDPQIGIEWPIIDPLLSERDRSAPPLAEVAPSLPG